MFTGYRAMAILTLALAMVLGPIGCGHPSSAGFELIQTKAVSLVWPDSSDSR